MQNLYFVKIANGTGVGYGYGLEINENGVTIEDDRNGLPGILCLAVYKPLSVVIPVIAYKHEEEIRFTPCLCFDICIELEKKAVWRGVDMSKLPTHASTITTIPDLVLCEPYFHHSNYKKG